MGRATKGGYDRNKKNRTEAGSGTSIGGKPIGGEPDSDVVSM